MIWSDKASYVEILAQVKKVKHLNHPFSVYIHEVIRMTQSQIGTIEVQELIYKRRVQRLSVTKGVNRGKLIDRVNAVSKHKKPVKTKKSE